VGAALLASAEGYTPRANNLLEGAREKLGTIQEIAGALADDLPAPKTGPSRSRRRRRRKKKGGAEGGAETQAQAPGGETGETPAAEPKPRRRRRRKPAEGAPAPAAPAEDAAA